MASVQLGSKSVGSSIKINVDNSAREFLVVQHGRPSSMYDNGWDNVTILLMKEIYENRLWHNSNVGAYESSTIHTYLNNTFLNLLDTAIRNSLMSVKLPYRAGVSGTAIMSGASGLAAKGFLLSVYEVESTPANTSITVPAEGACFSYFQIGKDARIASLNGNVSNWWLRSPAANNDGRVFFINNTGEYNHMGAATFMYGVRPALAFPSSLWVSDNGTLETNNPPTVPANISVDKDPPVSDEDITITWGASTDPDGNFAGYRLERAFNGGGYSQIYQGTALSYTDQIIKGWNTVIYRVKAYDTQNAESGYRTSATFTVDNNNAPEIHSDFSGDLGEKDADFEITYSVSDEEDNPITVTELIDGVELRSFDAEPETEYTFAVAGETFQTLLNGTHTLTVRASDYGKSSTLDLSFAKAVHACSISMREPMHSTEAIQRAILSIARSIPHDAAFQVLVTNNALDDEPVWEDATSSIQMNLNHVFENSMAENGFAFNFRIMASRAEGGEGGWIDSIGGAFA